MSRFHRILGVVASAAAALFAVVGLPSPARAAGNITVLVGNLGNATIGSCGLQVAVNDGNGLILTSMTVHLYLNGTTDAYDATDMTYVSGPANDQVWNSTGPIPADLAPGSYTVTVDAADADETDLGLPSPDLPFPISYSTTIAAKATPNTLSYGDTATTISGTVTGVKTCNPASVAMSGVPVDLITEGTTNTTTQIATTRADGSYSAPVQLPTAGVSQYVIAAESGATWAGSQTVPRLDWERDRTRLVSVQVTPRDATYGGTVTMTGRAEYDNAQTGWQPLALYPVSVLAGAITSGPTVQRATVMTNARGKFTWSYPVSYGVAWQATVGDGGLLAGSLKQGTIHVAVPVRFTSFSATLNPFGQLAVNACLKALATVPGWSKQAGSPDPGLVIQYSTTASGPWKTLGPANIRGYGPCSHRPIQAYYTGQHRVRLARAYYRAYAPPTPTNQAATSRPVLRWKYLTRIISLKISPRTVRRGGKITVSGRLQTDHGRWRALARQQVLIILKPKGRNTWYWIRKVRTSSTGHFTSTFTDPVTARWSAQYDGNATHFASRGPVLYVPVNAPGSAFRPLPAHLAFSGQLMLLTR